jgi:uncharacterized protein
MDPSSPPLVVDTWALMAHLLDEPEGPRVRTLLQAAGVAGGRILISAISLGEACYMIERRDGAQAVRAVLGALEDLRIEIADPDRGMILSATGVKARYTISFGDAFVVALAAAEQATVVTGDPDFRKVEHLVPVLWLGQEESGPAAPES